MVQQMGNSSLFDKRSRRRSIARRNAIPLGECQLQHVSWWHKFRILQWFKFSYFGPFKIEQPKLKRKHYKPKGASPLYRPFTTSHDFDAPISEAGDTTLKYFAIRNVISEVFNFKFKFDKQIFEALF